MSASSEHESAKTQGDVWTSRRLIRWIDSHLTAKGIDSPRVCAEMLVGHVVGAERMKLYMEADRPASATELERLRALVVRASRHEPVQYLVGEAWFWSKRFAVGPATLIPRPATEHLVEEAVASARAAAAAGARPIRVLEIGTGTGCISTCVAAALRGQRRGTEPTDTPVVPIDIQIIATDIVPGAIELARLNATAHGASEAIELRLGSIYEPLTPQEQGTFHVLISNPPYVRDDEWQEMAANVREHEPRSALAGGTAGMDVLAPLIANAHTWLAPAGRLVVEIGHRQHDDVLAAARLNPQLIDAEIRKDFEGFWRMLVATRR
ncbi:MAG: peptide chain release factor N(5)-glutamine methyltransferase [Planctomycetota bacterium]|nr:MAG: peptide chain release factor N(5)-glutamine methyltransferase [Planctomycetota bacterium]